MYSQMIRQSVEFIETNIHEPLSLSILAKEAGFSKYHFHRIFQKEIGVSASEYIRYRRLANAAHMLLYTDEKIIDIAFYYHFESQESFTRSFKKYYQIPPGQYRKLMSKLTLQREEITMKDSQLLKGWNLSGSNPFHYEMAIDRKNVHKGKASGCLKAIQPSASQDFATMMQQFKADKYLNKRLKLTGFIKTKDVDISCGLWMRIDDRLGDVLQFDNMSNRPITGDTEWNHYSIVLDIPKNSAVIAFGVLLSGNGSVWVDGIRFEEVDEHTPTTNMDFTEELLDEPVNLSFEEWIEH
ncbi:MULTISPECIES: AraC family transcriptional regulator [Bacillaceae]|uniref:helix-turn-helix transcriptional regulator n=1 Tax=Bacillaceae TaxID=186817 RepID=UPI001E33078C|nr:MULTISPECIES: AraC family transcriptional regulator [Bacillaceae]MCE4049106.1 AraC family transcriptional regulator [Bacillus sp. Au-Bac7]UPO90459.1 AraC family transcriptional regulator [Niallia sp. Man26]